MHDFACSYTVQCIHHDPYKAVFSAGTLGDSCFNTGRDETAAVRCCKDTETTGNFLKLEILIASKPSSLSIWFSSQFNCN